MIDFADRLEYESFSGLAGVLAVLSVVVVSVGTDIHPPQQPGGAEALFIPVDEVTGTYRFSLAKNAAVFRKSFSALIPQTSS